LDKRLGFIKKDDSNRNYTIVKKSDSNKTILLEEFVDTDGIWKVKSSEIEITYADKDFLNNKPESV